MNTIYLLNSISVGVFGIVLSAAFSGIIWTKKKYLIMAVGTAINLMFQGVIYLYAGGETVRYFYPIITHIPLVIVLYILSREFIWSTISVLTGYLCCQLRRWLALIVVVISSGDYVVQNVAELVITLPLLLFLLWFVAPSFRTASCYTNSQKIQFGIVPALYYGFDYLTRIYTNMLSIGNEVVVEFMPFVSSVAYLIFVLRTLEGERIRNQLKQTQSSLNLQVAQAVREISILRESSQKASTYRHDLRHHMQYLLSCIENDKLLQAREYILEICSEIEANKVIVFCENEAANLIFSAFVGRAKEHNIIIKIKASISQNIRISENDLCVLLSNALENAMNACQKLKEQGSIEVSAYNKNGKIFLQIANSYEGEIIFDNGIPITNNTGHGIGVQSICAIVEKYGGIYTFLVKDGRFILRIAF